jgi:hypothetical protein
LDPGTGRHRNNTDPMDRISKGLSNLEQVYGSRTFRNAPGSFDQR